MNPFWGATGGTSSTYTTSAATSSSSTYWISEAEVQAYQGAIQRERRQYQDAAAMERYRADVARQEAEFAERQARDMALLAERNKQHETACKRARDLLLDHLTPEQKKTFEKNGWFIVEGGRTKTKYRIRGQRYAGNIDVMTSDGKVSHRLCVHCAAELPLDDHLVSQKIMLEWAEDDIVRLANRHAA